MVTNSVLQFNGYELDKLLFINNDVEAGKEFSLTPKFDKRVNNSEPDKYDVTLLFSLEPTDGTERPFTIEVSMTGHFEIQNTDGISDETKNNLININAVAILFPFLRSTIASLTMCANIPPLVLPIVNLTDQL